MLSRTCLNARTAFRWLGFGIALMLLLGTPLVGCIQAPTPAPPLPSPTQPVGPQPGGRLVYGTWQAPDTMDIQTTILQLVIAISENIYDPLVRLDPKDNVSILPGLAEKWEVSSDYTEYTFHLRKDVKFHDGTPFNAEAVKKTFERITNPETKAFLTLTALGPYKSSEVLDEYTVKVTFSKPYGAFLNLLTEPLLAPISPAAVEKYGPEFADHPTGTGPFMLKEYVKNQHITLVRNPDYQWGPSFFHQGPAYLEEVTWVFLPENATRVAALEKGEVMMIDRVPPDDLARLKQDPRFKSILQDLAGAPWIMVLNVKKSPTDELAVRQAIEYAIDRQAIVDLIYSGTNVPHFSPLEKRTLGYDPSIDKIYSYDPEKAMKILDDAGWKTGADGIREKDGQKLQLIWIDWPASGIMEDGQGPVFQAQLKAVGMDVKFESYDVGTAIGAWSEGKHNIGEPFFYWNDPSVLRFLVGTGSGLNWVHSSDPELDAILEKAEAAGDPAQRKPLYVEAQRRVMEQAYLVPTFGKSLVLVFDKRLNGFAFSPTGYPIYTDLYLAND